MRARSIWIAMLLCAVFAVPVLADWDEGTPAKWVQYPDLTPMGIDVNVSPMPRDYILADDFLCTERGLITGIHIWGSWLDDALPADGDPTAVAFTLSIHADIPEDPTNGEHSRPGELLWMMDFQEADFTARVWAENIDEGWMDAPEQYLFPGDHICWQYNFDIPADMAFEQMGDAAEPVVYWLDVKAYPRDEGTLFGWKTSFEHWNDNAVWGEGPEPYTDPWYELYYPPAHELQGQQIDLAFVIEGEEIQTSADWGDAPATYTVMNVAGGAYHVINPGMFLGASVDAETDGQPDTDAEGDDNDGNDDEDGVVFGPLVPGLGATVAITASMPGAVDVWIDYDLDHTWLGASDVVLTAAPVNGGTTTVLNFTVPTWVTGGTTTFARVRYSSVGGLPIGGGATEGEVEDYKVTIEESMVMKWIQPPDLSVYGIDINASNRPQEYILADDFLCSEIGPVTDIWVYGSWLDDYLPFGEDPRAVKFTLSFHTDVPHTAGNEYSHPGEVLWFRDFEAGDFEVEIVEEQINEGWMDPPEDYIFPGDHVCWLYKFHVDPHLAWEQRGTPDSPRVYWLDVKAEPLDADALWGWKTSTDHWNDDATWGVGHEPYPGPWYELIYPPMHELAGQSIDLAFALFEDRFTVVPEDLPERSHLERNAPNPFNPQTVISYVLSETGRARIDIFDVMGRLVRSLVDEEQTAGPQRVTWYGRDDAGRAMPSGVYFYRLIAPGCDDTMKMVLLR